MPSRHSAPLASAALAMVLLLTGCFGGAEPVPCPTTDAAEPVFASDEEALEAAVATYQRYLDLSDQIEAENGADAMRFSEIATEDYLPVLVDDMDSFMEAGLRSTGTTTFDSMTLASRNITSWGSERVSIYLCVDVTNTRIEAANGQDVTPADRDVRIPLSVTFLAASENDVLIDSSERWPGDDFC